MFLGLDSVKWVLELEFLVFAILAVFPISKDAKMHFSLTKEKVSYIILLSVVGAITAISAIFLMKSYNHWFGPLFVGIFGIFALTVINFKYRKRRSKLVHER